MPAMKDLHLPCAALLCVALFGCGALFAADIYVSPTGDDDANTGALGSPFRQIRKAIEVVQPGDTVHVATGSYLGFDAFDLAGTAVNPITIVAAGQDADILVTGDRGDNRDTIYIDNCTYLTVDGMRCMNGNRAGIRVQGGDHVTVRNCVCGDNDRWGIFTGFSENILLENNTCYGSAVEHGIYFSNSADNPTIRGNTLFENNANGLHMNGDIVTQPPGGGADGIISSALVENNVIYDNGAGGGSGINCDGVQDSVIRNNLIYDAHHAGISLYQIDGGGPSTGNLVVNNTVQVASDGKWCLQLHDDADDTTVFSNILINEHPTFRGCININVADVPTGLVSDYNILIAASGNIASVDDDNTTYDLGEWQGLGYDENSFTSSAAALFDGTGHGFFLRSDSPARDAGVTMLNGENAPAGDLEGIARVDPDIGAFEYSATGSPNTAPVITAGPLAAPDPGEAGVPVAFSVSAFDADSDPLTFTWDFGDGQMGAGATPTHTYFTDDTFTVTVTVSDGIAQAQDAFSLTINPPSFAALVADKLALKLNFAKPAKDSVSAKGTVPDLPGDFIPGGADVTFNIGGVAVDFSLDAKGKGIAGAHKCRLKFHKKKGWQFTLKLAGGDYAATWAALGLNNADLDNVPRAVTVILSAGGNDYGQIRAVLYRGKAGKSGRAKSAK